MHGTRQLEVLQVLRQVRQEGRQAYLLLLRSSTVGCPALSSSGFADVPREVEHADRLLALSQVSCAACL